ncbi:hypothetical protein GCM10009733_106790 [Nonomuraea maheshkhaliensis]|uniref:Uncharacterized protein n=1 Tax=Nonomuraea maheshkhaliensis TaxID=419590 RepID=A0ABN2HU44_9ACTN
MLLSSSAITRMLDGEFSRASNNLGSTSISGAFSLMPSPGNSALGHRAAAMAERVEVLGQSDQMLMLRRSAAW